MSSRLDPLTILLAIGAIAGAALGAVGIAPSARPVPSGAVALVDDAVISRDDYERALSAVAADRRSGDLTPDDRRRVLDRLVDEQLLVARALELGLAHSDRRVRADLVSAVIDSIVLEAEAEPVDEAELRAFHRDNEAIFRTTPRVRIEHAFFRGADAHDRAARALRSTAPLDGDRWGLPLPRGLLSLRVVSERLGPSVARAVADLRPGEHAAPVRARDGVHVVRLVERIDGELPPFEAMEAQVREEHRRRMGEQRVRAFLDERRREVSVRIGGA